MLVFLEMEAIFGVLMFNEFLSSWLAGDASGVGANIVLSFLAGVLTSLSPCVYPLIPITLGVIGARKSKTYFEGFKISLIYVMGMVTLYTTLGVLFALFGVISGGMLQQPWFVVILAAFFILISLSMFGFYEFSVPAPIMNKLSKVGGTGHKGVFLMGLVAGIIAAPCTGPVSAWILSLISTKGSIAQGSLYMFFYALGLGLLFLILGTFSSLINRIPKSGSWMQLVRYVFGVGMLTAAWYYLQIAFEPLQKMLVIPFYAALFLLLLLVFLIYLVWNRLNPGLAQFCLTFGMGILLAFSALNLALYNDNSTKSALVFGYMFKAQWSCCLANTKRSWRRSPANGRRLGTFKDRTWRNPSRRR